jgi:small subunit ribosomal protein S1
LAAHPKGHPLSGRDNSQGRANKARETAWERLQRSFQDYEIVEGVIIRCVRRGYVVAFEGVTGFLPGSQLDGLPVVDIAPFLDRRWSFKILKCDPEHGRLVVSRRATLPRAGICDVDLEKTYYVGQRLPGVVVQVAAYGAFIDIGEITGLLPSRSTNPALEKGQTINVVVVEIDTEIQRVVLAIDRLESDGHPS